MDRLTLQECLIEALRQLEAYKNAMSLREDAYDFEAAIRKLTEQLFSLQVISDLKGSLDDISHSISLLRSLTVEAGQYLEQGFELDDTKRLIAKSLSANYALSKVTLGGLCHI
ncbi:hypothetical protein [Vibrio hangzhouensis]|uniref:hypothetical protein n=1 Tax=Vibrio hangzhouensis TaxID=462991 RepID=UPI001C965BD6|nr:hypothetical protein [Vibrio hangzhouensis]MBY6195639.1 hypothetical protein [Vibrio hangzhouensis]